MSNVARSDSIAFINGEIFSMDSQEKKSALYARGGIIKSLGDDKDVLSLCDTKTVVLDMRGKFLMPGFTDTHIRLLEIGRRGMGDEKEFSEENIKYYYDKGIKEVLKFGITSVQTDDTSALKNNFKILDFYKSVADSPKIAPRITPQLAISNLEELHELINSKSFKEYRDTFQTTPPIKIKIDGMLCDRSAALIEEYSDKSGYFGLCNITQEELDEIVKNAHKEVIQLIFQATGDAAIERCLNAIEKKKDQRFGHRIESCRVGAEKAYKRIKELNLMIDITPFLLSKDMNSLLLRLGAERSRMCDSWKSMILNGITVGSGSDGFCNIDPCQAIRILLFRQDENKQPQYGWIPSQRLSRDEAFSVYTVSGAKVCMEELSRGTLSVGKMADIIAFTENPMKASYEELLDIQIGLTVVDGRIAYIK